MSVLWTADHVPVEVYDIVRARLAEAEKLLGEIKDGKHSIPGCLVQIDRYFNSKEAA